MKQILLVGKFTQRFRELNKVLASMYEVRTCVNKLDIFDGMYQIKQPDVIILIVEEKEDSDEEMLDEIEYDEDGNLVEKSSYDDNDDSFDE